MFTGLAFGFTVHVVNCKIGEGRGGSTEYFMQALIKQNSNLTCKDIVGFFLV